MAETKVPSRWPSCLAEWCPVARSKHTAQPATLLPLQPLSSPASTTHSLWLFRVQMEVSAAAFMCSAVQSLYCILQMSSRYYFTDHIDLSIDYLVKILRTTANPLVPTKIQTKTKRPIAPTPTRPTVSSTTVKEPPTPAATQKTTSTTSTTTTTKTTSIII